MEIASLRKGGAMQAGFSGSQPLIDEARLHWGLDANFRQIINRWGPMKEGELVARGREFITENMIRNRTDFQNQASGLFKALRRRGLLERMRYVKSEGTKASPQPQYAGMDGAALVAAADGLVSGKKIGGRMQLQKEAPTLFRMLKNRGLVDDIGFETARGFWESKGNEEILALAAEFREATGITARKKLQKAHSAIYCQLLDRGLLDAAGFPSKRPLIWAKLGDTALVNYSKKLMKKQEMKNKNDLKKKAPGLWSALQTRKLLAAFDSRPRWCAMHDDPLVDYAIKLMKREKIKTRTGLRKAEGGLYYALWERGLLQRVAPPALLPKWSLMSDLQIVSHAKSYMRRSGISTRGKLRLLSPTFYNVLCERKLLDAAGVQHVPCRRWSAMKEQDVIAYAQREIDEKGLLNKEGLKDSDRGAYDAIRNRGLFGRLTFKGELGSQEAGMAAVA
jgi:hypothetical protein